MICDIETSLGATYVSHSHPRKMTNTSIEKFWLRKVVKYSRRKGVPPCFHHPSQMTEAVGTTCCRVKQLNRQNPENKGNAQY